MAVEIVGEDKIIAKLDSLADLPRIKKAVTKACGYVERDAKNNCPSNGEGALRRSIGFEVQSSSTEVTGIIGTSVEYAPYVEYGTGLFAEAENGRQGYWVYVEGSDYKSKTPGRSYTLEGAKRLMAILRSKGLEAYYTNGQKPHPFLRPALKSNRERIKQLLKEGVKQHD